MNVLYLDHFNRHGGAQEYILDLADWMAGQGVKAFVNDFATETLHAPGRRFASTGFPLLGLDYRRPSFHLRAAANLFQLRKFLRRERIDLIHCNSIPALALARLARQGQRIVFTCHDCLEARAKILFVKALPDHIIAVSEAVKSHLRSKGVAKPVTAIHNGFPDHGQGISPAPAGDAVTIGLVARLVPWKGCDLFIEAARRLSADYPRARFHLIGNFEDEGYRKKILASIAGTSISHVAFKREKRAIYESLDVLVNASVEVEPFGRTLAEAGMFQRPAVGPDRGGPAEIIVNGVTGFTFANGRAESLERRLRSLIDSPLSRADLGASARRHFLETFAMDIIGGKVMSVYSAV